MKQNVLKEMTINERICYFRKVEGLTQSQVAEKMGMKLNAYSKMEREGRITVDRLSKLAQILDVDYGLLMKGEETEIKYMPFPVQPVGDGQVVLGQPPIVIDSTPKSRIPEYIPTAREKAAMKTVHYLPKPVQEEIYDFIDMKKKECGK